MKKIKIAFLLSIVMVLLMGCAKGSAASKFEPKATSVYITKEGNVVSATIDDFGKEYYDSQEFKTLAEQEVIKYNTAKAGMSAAYAEEAGKSDESTAVLPVAIESCETADGKATVILSYAGVEEFLSFIEIYDDPSIDISGLTISTIENAKASGINLEGEFVKADGSAADLGAVTKKGNYYVVSVEGEGTIQTEGKITFLSKNVTKIDDNTVTCSGSDVSYIIFK